MSRHGFASWLSVIGPLRLFAIAFLLRLAWAVAVDTSTNVLDAQHYLHLGKVIAATGAFTQDGVATAFRPVGYPFFVSLCYHLPGDTVLWIQIVQSLLGALLCVMVYAIALRVHDSRTVASVCGLVCAGMPSFLSASTVVWSEGVFAFLLTASVACALLVPRPIAAAALAGAMLGLACYFRPNGLLVLPFLFAHLLIRREWRGYVFKSAVALTLLLAVTLPWTMRNVRAMGRPVWISTHLGYNLYSGHHPGNAVGYHADSVLVALDTSGASETELSRTYKRLALEHIKAHPWQTVVMTARRFATLVLRQRDTVYLSFLVEENPRFTLPQKALAGVNNLLWLVLVFGFLLAHRWRAIAGAPQVAGFCGAFWLQVLFYSTVYAVDRYTFPVAPLAVLAGVPQLAWAYAWLRSKVARAVPVKS